MHSIFALCSSFGLRSNSLTSIVRLAILAFTIVTCTKSASAQFDYRFWMPPVWNTGQTGHNQPSELFITTPYPFSVDVHIETPDGVTFVFDGTVSSGNPLSIALTPTLGQTNVANTAITNNGFIVTSTSPIQCVHKVSAQFNQTLATLKGRNGRGTDFWCGSQVRNLNANYSPNEYHFISVMAMENNTTIEFTTPFGMYTAAPGDLPTNFTINLNQNQCYLIRGNNPIQHVAGAHVESNKEIVVISGSTHTRISGPGANAADGGTDQLVPIELAGTQFALIAGDNDPSFDYAIIVGTENSTNIYLDGSGVAAANIDAGEYFDWTLTGSLGTPHTITTDKTAYVYHVSGTSQDDEVDMSAIPQLDCTGSRYIEFSKFTVNTAQQTLQLLATPESESTLTVNGVYYQNIPGVIYNNVPGLPGWKSVSLTTNSLANNNVIQSEGFFHAGWLTGNSGSTGAYGFLSGFDDAFDFLDPITGLPTNIYLVATLCQGDDIDHCINVVSCGTDHEIISYSGNVGTIDLAPPSSPFDTCFRYTAPFGFVGYDTINFVVDNNFGFQGELEIVFLVVDPNAPIDAGPNQTLCGATSTTLAAVNPDPYATGYWTVLQGGATITSPTNPTTTVTNLALGTNSFLWHQDYPCDQNLDIVQVFRYSGVPPIANAGPDVQLCGGSAYVMQANSAGTTGLGIWEITCGQATIGNINSATALVTNIGLGINCFEWNIDNGPCPGSATSDQMTIFVFNPNHPPANAGTDQFHCFSPGLTVGLNASIPQSPATGAWTLVSGSGTIANASNPFSTATNLSVGQNIFQWTISNGPCPALSDQIIIWVYNGNAPAASAGPDQTTCLPQNSATLAGNTPVFPATGAWTVINGTGSFANTSSPITSVSGLSVGTNTFRWTINNGPCAGAITFDNVVINVFPASQPTVSAGPDQQFCDVGVPLSAVLSGSSLNPPGSGLWTVVSGTGAFANAASPNTTVFGLSPGQNVYQWTVSNGGCSPIQNDQVMITIFDGTPAFASAGLDAALCTPNSNYIMQATPVLAPATGQWSLISGSGSIANSFSPSTNISNLGTGVNVFRWTTLNGPCGNSNFDEVTVTLYNNNAAAANAGVDQELCSSGVGVINTFLNGNVPAAPSTGLWTLLSGTGTIMNPSNPNSQVQNMAVGTNIFQWTINNGPCGNTQDQITFFVFSPGQTSANAGADQTLCSTQTNTTLTANSVLSPATGLWTLVSGSGTIVNPNQSTTNVTGLGFGTNIFQWSIDNGPCASPATLLDQVSVVLFNSSQATASAGNDQVICNTTSSVAMSANSTTFPATGQWSVIIGAGIFANSTSPITSVSGLSIGVNTFQWTISNGPCGNSSDQISITVFNAANVIANAGPNQEQCLPNTSAQLAASGVIFPSVGTWTLIQGSAIFANANNPNTTVSGLGVGENILQWSVTNGPCGPTTTDQMTIVVFDNTQGGANAGPDVSFCTPVSSFVMQANQILFPAVGQWSVMAGSGTFSNLNDPNATVSGLGIGTNTFRWTVLNGPCPGGTNFDDISIFIFSANQPIASAGPDQEICSTGIAPVNATLVGSLVTAPGTGVWTLVLGTGTIASPTSSTTQIFNLGVGQNVFQWTVSNGPCANPTSLDQVSIFVFSNGQLATNAGPDQSLCSNAPSTALDANELIFPATGQWTVLSGSAVFVNANNPNTTVSGLSLGTNILQWIVDNGPCANPVTLSDQMTIVVFNVAQASANAGPDQSICSDNAQTNLSGNPVLAPATGSWSLISGTGTIASPSNPNTLVSNLGIGANVFQWSISNGACAAPGSDQVTIFVYNGNHPPALAGSDQSICLPQTNSVLSGSAVVFPAIGTWTLVQGSGVIASPNSPSTNVSGLSVGQNIFRWTISNGPCSLGILLDEVSIFIYDNAQGLANAGSDQSFCEPISTAGLSGNPVIFPATGIWTVVSGTGLIFDPSNPNTQVSNLSVGQNTFQWTITNGPCGPSVTSNQMSIFIFDDSQLQADAGEDQFLCSPAGTIAMDGSPIIFPASGIWELLSGTGVISDPTNPNTSIAGLSVGENIFTWTVSNGPCADANTADSVSIFVYQTNAPVANAGSDQNICTPQSSIYLSGNVPVFPATGIWTLENGTGIIVDPTNPSSTVTNLGVGTNVFRWTVDNGGCVPNATSDLLTIWVYSADSPIAFAGEDQDICQVGDPVFLVASVPVFPAYGEWSIVSGTGIFSDINDPNAQISNVPVGIHIFEWTVFNGPCANGITTDQITVVLYDTGQLQAVAGIDQELCSPQEVTVMNADPAVFPGSGTWALTSGSGTIEDVNDPFSQISDLQIGVNTFSWTVNYATCGSQSDDISIIVFNSAQGEAVAGADQEFCSPISSSVLDANAVLAPAFGTWSVISGGASVSQSNNPQSAVQNLTIGDNMLVWTVYNGTCLDPLLTTDTINIIIYNQAQALPYAGEDQFICTPQISVVLNADAVPYPAIGMWVLQSGSGSFDDAFNPNATLSGLGVGITAVQWTIDNGPCSPLLTDNVDIYVFDQNNQEALAGPDQSLCSNVTTSVLNGSALTLPSTGFWTVLSGTAIVVSPNDPNSQVINLTPGEHVLQWSVNNGPCNPITTSEMSIFIYDEDAPAAYAGEDQELCIPFNSTTFEANFATFPGIGQWAILQGSGNFQNTSSPFSFVNGLQQGENVFLWTIFNGPCPNQVTSDVVSIFLYDPAAAPSNAGPNQSFCEPVSSTFMQATEPDVPGFGTWSLLSGSGVIADINDFETGITGLQVGENIFRWTLYNGPCTTSGLVDEVSIFIFDDSQPVADAGPDQQLCTPVTSAVMAANNVIFPAVGTWTIVQGGGSISNVNDPQATMSNLAIGNNVFSWTINNGPCSGAITTNTVVISLFNQLAANANAGPDQEFCLPQTSALLSGSPINGAMTGVWTLIEGSANILNSTSSTATVNGLSVGLNVFSWSVNNGPCGTSIDTSTVFIFDPEAPEAFAGGDVSLCTPVSTYIMEATIPQVPGVGTWQLIGGSGSIDDINDPNATVSGLIVGANTFSWTVYNGPCEPPTTDVMTIFIFDENAQQAIAGDDVEMCLPSSSYTMMANEPIYPAFGYWTITEGSAVILDDESPTTAVQNLAVGENIFVWVIDNGVCENGATSDTISVFVFDYEATFANAGEDQSWCEPVSTTFLVATTPDDPGYGTWQLISGCGIVMNPNNPESEVTDLCVGENLFAWVVYNGPCANSNSTDFVSIFIFDDSQESADAGVDQELCTPITTTQLEANSVIFPATGTWSLIQGNGSINNVNDPNALFSNIGSGVNVLVWTIFNGPCVDALTADTVLISVFISDLELAYAGEDQEICLPQTSVELDASNLTGAAVGQWSVFDGAGNFESPNDDQTSVDNIEVGENVYVWFVDNGICGVSRDTVSVFLFDPQAAVADAGPDVSYCTPVSGYTLQANAPEVPGVGTWTTIPGGVIHPDSIHDPNAFASGLIVGETIFIWSIYNGPCAAPTMDLMSVFIYDESAPDAYAGEDIEICLPQNSVNMIASPAIFPAVGQWSLIEGSGSIVDVNNPMTEITNLGLGTNCLVWTVNNGPCPNMITSDTICVSVFEENIVLPNAGPDQEICTPMSVVEMSANMPTAPGYAHWTLVSGSANIEELDNPQTQITSLAVGENVFTWTFYNGPCSNALPLDTVIIFVFDQSQESANAGPDQEICLPQTTVQLSGNVPTVPASGQWTLIEGSANIADANDPATVVTELAQGVNTFVWAIDNGPCSEALTSDTMFVFVFDDEAPLANAGNDFEICTPENCIMTTAGVPLSPAYGTWEVLSGSASISDVNNPAADICNLTVGETVLLWTVYNGPCDNTGSTDTIRVFVFNATAQGADAGGNIELCDPDNSFILQGNNAEFPAFGLWSITGPGSIDDPTNPNATVSGLEIGESTLYWTINNGPCGEPSVDDMKILLFDPNSSNALAGPDIALCEDFPNITLEGNPPIFPALGTWTLISGEGDITNPNDPNTTVENVGYVNNIFVWTIYNGACENSLTSDSVYVYVNSPTISAANAGDDESFCGDPGEITLNGSVTILSGTSTWTVVEGGGDIDDITNNNPLLSNMPLGVNTYVYTVDNGICNITADTVQMILYDPTIDMADAGFPVTICQHEFTSVNLMGNEVVFPATSYWTVINGPGEILDPDNPDALVTSLGEIVVPLEDVATTFVYTIDNGVCGTTSDTIVWLLQDCLTIEIPDAFSPNGDGVNDYFEIPNIGEYPKNRLEIFNRWGAKIYEAAPYQNDWDGRSEHPATFGEQLPVSTYYYVLDLGTDEEAFHGFIYLKR